MRRALRWTIRASCLVLTAGAVAVAVGWWVSQPDEPDAFYDASTAPTPEPGQLLRSEPYSLDVPPEARAWRILYTTMRADGRPAVASAVVMAPRERSAVPRPTIAWAHGTTGIARGCAPSVVLPFNNVPAIAELIREGWVYVAADYVGLGTAGGHAYLIGEDAAHAVLDAVRTARRMSEISLDARVVVWGHSQGGHSSLWSGILAPSYASELNVLGIAALAPASDLRALVTSARASLFGKIVSAYLVTAYGASYPDVASAGYVRPAAQLLASDMAARCVGDRRTLFSVLESALLGANGIFARDPASGPLGERLQDNTPRRPIAAPVLIAQGEADDLVLPDVQRRFVATRCAAGQRIDFHTYPQRDHISLVAADSPLIADLMMWTRDRLDGRASTATC